MEFLNFLYISIGVLFLYLGSEWLLTGTLAVADKLNIPKVFSAVVLIGFGTSVPELFVSIDAVLDGSVDLAIGNIMGSNVANILLVSGFALMLAPIVRPIKYIGYECVFFLLASIAPLILAFMYGGITPAIGWTGLVVICIYFYLSASRPNIDKIDEEIKHLSTPRILAYLTSGLFLLVLGAKSLVIGAVLIAISFGVSQAVIGLSMVAIGTSLPEIATTISSARRGHGEMIIGNVLGSNLFNTLLVLSTVATYEWIDLSWQDFGVELILIPALSIGFVIVIYAKGLRRPMGIISLIGYAIYIASLVGR